MREATETLDLTPVLEMLERWHRVALLSRDAERHRRMLDHAERLQRREDLPMEPWSVTKARLGLRALFKVHLRDCPHRRRRRIEPRPAWGKGL